MTGTLLALPLLLALGTGDAVGPPWIGIEYPANPHDAETRGALMVVHTYHHATALAAPITAEALGMRDGRRATIPLEVRATSRPGIYAVRGELPGSGAWVVEIQRGTGSGGATALVAMNDRGDLLAVRVPHRPTEDGRWLVPVRPTADEVERLLRTAVAMDDAARATALARGAGAALLLLVAVPSGAWLARRRPRA